MQSFKEVEFSSAKHTFSEFVIQYFSEIEF